MGSLVGINAGMLDQNLAGWNGGMWGFAGGKSRGKLVATNAGVDVASPGEFQLLKTLDRADSSDDLLGDLARGLAQLLGKIKGQRQRVFAQVDTRRLFNDDSRQVEPIAATQKVAHMIGKPAFQMAVQGSPVNC